MEMVIPLAGATILGFPILKPQREHGTKDCCVYIIAKNEAGEPSTPIKVGIADNPAKRLRNLQTASPFDLMLVHYFPMPSREIASFVEKAFHSTQADRNIRGEWFDINFVQAMQLMCMNVRVALMTKAPGLSAEYLHLTLELTNVVDCENKLRKMGVLAPGDMM
jgi:hypothetical protein